MIGISIDGSDPRPAYDQIREQVTDLVRSGSLAADHRLPSVRQLAGDLRVAPGTVARAYTELEADGLVASSRTGTRVRAVDPLPPALREAARVYVAALRDAGAVGGDTTLDDAIRALRVEWLG